MTIQQAIEKAVSGGWKMEGFKGKLPLAPEQLKSVADIHLEGRGIHEILLDPTFWQALGKVEGWSVEEGYNVSPVLHEHSDGEGYKELCGKVVCETVGVSKIWPVWLKNMHRLIDHLGEGGDITGYFESL